MSRALSARTKVPASDTPETLADLNSPYPVAPSSVPSDYAVAEAAWMSEAPGSWKRPEALM
jgi:hypothetical protein